MKLYLSEHTRFMEMHINVKIIYYYVVKYLPPRVFFVSSQNSEVRSQFQEFLSLSGHLLEQRPFPDVVQLALSQPHTSEVYKQARLQAQDRANNGKLYFDLMYENILI